MVNTMGNVFHRKPRDTDKDVTWRIQTRELQENPMFQYVNMKKGGRLVDLYVEVGPAAVEQVIIDEITPFLYNSGKGAVVEKIEYVRWKSANDAKLAGTSLVDTRPDELVLSDFKENEFNAFVEHTACWDINKRGTMGENLLHMCVLHNTPIHTDIAKILLRAFPKLALDFCLGEEYYGESSLHLAIVYGDLEMVKLLVGNGANVNQQTTGKFFLPEDVKKGKNKSNTNYEGYAYFGEYPLAFAACFGHEHIYDYLIEHGADPNLQDSFGNTVLHMLVISNQLGMYSYAVKHHLKPAKMETANYANLTPLTLASKLARNSIFKEIIEIQSAENWRYSNISCSTYPLSPIDTIGIDGKTNWNSALMIITDGETDDHLEMLEGGVLKQLVDDKWKTYARRRFVQRLILAFFHLLTLSIAIYLRPACITNSVCPPLNGPSDAASIVRYIAEIIVTCACLSVTILQLAEIRSQGIWGFLKSIKNAPAKSLFNLGCIFILLAVPMRFLDILKYEETFVAIAAPCSWTFLLFFARGAAMLGPSIIIIYKMLASDVFRFFIIFVVFIIQFSQVFYFLFKDIKDKNIVTFRTPPGTIMTLFQMTLGEFKMSKGELSVQYEDFDSTHYPELTKAVFAVFAILVPILLLNMLIAMMGNTYQQVIQRSEKEWRRQWAKIVIVLERSFSPKQLRKFQEEYSVPFGDKARGLMVIKASSKTKARQRKGAIANWKKLVYEVKALIKERKKQGLSGSFDLTSSEVTEKLNERHLRKRRSRVNTRQSFDEDDGTPGSADDIGKGLMSAVGQLAWEKDIDLSLNKASADFMKSAGITEEEIDNLEKAIAPVTEKVPLVFQSNKKKLSGIDNLGFELNDLSKTSDTRKTNNTEVANVAKDTQTSKSIPVNVTKKDQTMTNATGRPESSSSNASKGSKVHKKTGSKGGHDTASSSASSSASRSNEVSMLLPNDKSRKKKKRPSMSNSVGSISSILNAWDDKKMSNTKV